MANNGEVQQYRLRRSRFGSSQVAFGGAWIIDQRSISAELATKVAVGLWTAYPTSNGTISPTAWYQVINQNSNKRVDTSGWGTENGAIVQWWMPEALGSGWYRFRACHSGKCLNVTNVSGADGVQLQQWTCTGGTVVPLGAATIIIWSPID